MCVCVWPEVTQQASGKAMPSPARDLGSAQGLWSFKNQLTFTFQLPARSAPAPRPGSHQLGGGGQGKEVRTGSGAGWIPAVGITRLAGCFPAWVLGEFSKLTS